MGLLFDRSLKLELFDKDMKFDDYIGETILDVRELGNILNDTDKTQLKLDLMIKSVQDKNKSTGSIALNARKVTHFVSMKDLS